MAKRVLEQSRYEEGILMIKCSRVGAFLGTSFMCVGLAMPAQNVSAQQLGTIQLRSAENAPTEGMSLISESRRLCCLMAAINE